MFQTVNIKFMSGQNCIKWMVEKHASSFQNIEPVSLNDFEGILSLFNI